MDPFDGLSEATPTELPERQHEEGLRGGISGEKQLCDNRGNTCRVDFSLRELLGIAKKEFHDLLMDLTKRKRQSTDENAPRVNANTISMNDTEVEDEIPNSHYTRPH